MRIRKVNDFFTRIESQVFYLTRKLSRCKVITENPEETIRRFKIEFQGLETYLHDQVQEA